MKVTLLVAVLLVVLGLTQAQWGMPMWSNEFDYNPMMGMGMGFGGMGSGMFNPMMRMMNPMMRMGGMGGMGMMAGNDGFGTDMMDNVAGQALMRNMMG